MFTSGAKWVCLEFFNLDYDISLLQGWMDGAIFASFSTVFQSYQDDGRVLMKGCVQRHLVYVSF